MMKLIWKQWQTIPSISSFGHGVHFHDMRKARQTSLVAWVQGYQWLHGNPEEVVIWVIPSDSVSTESFLSDMKEIVGSFIRHKKVPFGNIGRNLEAFPNA